MKKIRGLTKNRIILLCVVCVLAIAATVLTVTAAARWHTLSCQRAAERFRGDSDARFAQVSAFFPEGKGTDLKGVYTFRQSLETALVAAAVVVLAKSRMRGPRPRPAQRREWVPTAAAR